MTQKSTKASISAGERPTARTTAVAPRRRWSVAELIINGVRRPVDGLGH